jgi:hypothetical protein
MQIGIVGASVVNLVALLKHAAVNDSLSDIEVVRHLT